MKTVIIPIALFVLGVILMLVSGTDGHKETMNTMSYIGLGVISLSVSYFLWGGFFVSLFKKDKKNGES